MHEGSSVGTIGFFNSASCGDGTNFSVLGGIMNFAEVATAATAHFTVSGDGGVPGTVYFFGGTAANATFSVGIGGSVEMHDNSTAPNATFTVAGGTLTIDGSANAGESVIDCSEGGQVIVSTYSTGALGGPQVTAHGATSSGRPPGQISLTQGGTADHATFVVEGGTSAGAPGAVMYVLARSNLQNAQVTVTGGTSGGDGSAIVFKGKSDGGRGSITMSGNATFDMRKHDPVFLSIGSIEGEGSVLLGSNQLQLGNNNLNATFSGVIEEGCECAGSLNKIGTGILTLSGANTYTGGTILTGGGLVISNATGSGTGTGNVTVQAGKLGGSGIIAGATTIGTGSGAGAFLAPAVETNVRATLTIQSTLTFNADATYTYTFRAKRNRARTDKVIANGVTINSGATLALSGQTRGALRQGMVLTLISNTSANPISGTFSNLPDGGIVIINGNNLQASYSGGDGNDLTLTVMP